MTPITLTIATYNRAKLLADTLESLCRQTVRPGQYELLLIDNNSSDDTQAVIGSFAGRLNFKYLKETRQGLSWCRNRAVAEFRGDVLIFTDDDMLFERDWLEHYISAIEAFPDGMIFGSRMLPAYDGGRPRWIRDESMPAISGVLGSLDLGRSNRMMHPGEVGPFGASFAVRRVIFERVGVFDTTLGRAGATLGRGEETDLFQRAEARMGVRPIYVGAATCHHRVDARRLAIKSLYAQGVESGKAFARLTADPTVPSAIAPMTFILKALGQWAKGRGDRARQCIMNAGNLYGQRLQAQNDRRARDARTTAC